MAKRAAESKAASGRRVRRLSVTELARRLSELLNRVHFQRETVIVERGGKPLRQLMPVPRALDLQLSHLVMLLDSLPSRGEDWAEGVAQGVAEQGEFEGLEWPR